MEKPQYIDWIVEETGIVIKDDIPLKCYKIDYKDDESILDDWALHIRRNYIEDTELKEDADDNAMTIEQYLHDYVIPQKGEGSYGTFCRHNRNFNFRFIRVCSSVFCSEI